MKRLAVAFTALTLFAGGGGCVSMGTNYDPVAVSQIAPGTPMAAHRPWRAQLVQPFLSLLFCRSMCG